MPAQGIDPEQLSVIVHDLRNALNAMVMTLYCIESGLPQGHDLLRSDVEMLGEGVGQLRHMLDILSAYGQNVLDSEKPIAHRKFDPARLVQDVVAEAESATRGRRCAIVGLPGAPREVEGSEDQAHLALRYGLRNAMAAVVQGSEVEVQVGGGPGVWRTRFVTPEAPADTVQAGPVEPDDIHRLVGNARERRGMDLAIVAALYARNGGTCRIEVESDHRSALVLDWPVRPLA